MKGNKNICGVYKITNPVGEIYVGSSKDIINRIRSHKNFQPSSSKINKSLSLYKYENHFFEILEECEFNELLLRERYYILIFDSVNKGLNSHAIHNTKGKEKNINRCFN